MRSNRTCPASGIYDAQDLAQIAQAEGEGMWQREGAPSWPEAHQEAFNAGRGISYPSRRFTLEGCSNE